MSAANRHIIRKVAFQIGKEKRDGALALQETVSELFWKELVPELETFFNEWAGPEELIRIDPESLIIVINDHLPPMAPNNGYAKLKFESVLTADDRLALKENLLFVIKEGKPLSKGLMRHKDMFYTALDYITNGRYCRDRSCRMKDHFAEFRGQNYRKGYLSLVSLASK